MNTVLISILVFILGLIIGVLGLMGINALRKKNSVKEALNIIEQAKKSAEKNKRESIWRQKKKFIN